MNKNEVQDLFRRYNDGTASAEQRILLENWYSEAVLEKQQVPASEDLLMLKQEAWASIYKQTVPLRRVSLWPRMAVAIAVATVIFGVGLFYFSKDAAQRDTELTVLQADVAPGISGATLTLGSGKKIKLSDAKTGKLAEQGGVIIRKAETGELVYELKEDVGSARHPNTLSTANGETYKLRLPDGTYVWLNSASTLIYTSELVKNGKRSVELRGEAFFEVAKDRAHPFVVTTAGQEVEVLGTKFNINAYADEPAVATTLLEGAVKLHSDQGNRILKPGQLALRDADGIRVSAADTDAITDWKNNEFFLDKLDFRVAMRKIARWYDIEVIYTGSVPEHLEAGGWIPRNSKLSDVLKSIEATGQVNFKREGRKVYVSK